MLGISGTRLLLQQLLVRFEERAQPAKSGSRESEESETQQFTSSWWRSTGTLHLGRIQLGGADARCRRVDCYFCKQLEQNGRRGMRHGTFFEICDKIAPRSIHARATPIPPHSSLPSGSSPYRSTRSSTSAIACFVQICTQKPSTQTTSSPSI